MSKRLRRWIVVLAMLAGVVVVSSKYLARQIETGKTVRDASGTIVGKEYVRFDAGTAFYTNDEGAPIPLRAGEEQWRIYYRLDSLPKDGEDGGRLLRAEQDRVTSGRLRIRILSKDCYDRTPVGGRITASYRRLAGAVIEVVGVDVPMCGR